MIKIEKPYIIIEKNIAKLKANIIISESTALKYKKITETLTSCPWRTNIDYPPHIWKKGKSELIYEVDKKYVDYLCTERSDGYVIAMLWYAIIVEEDIIFETPLSKRLYDGLTQKIIPAICQKQYKHIKLIGPITTEKLECKGAIGTGMSCGVDSFYSLHTINDITHLMFCECGHIFQLFGILNKNASIEEYYQKVHEIADKRASNAAEIAKQTNKEFIYIKSNLDENFYRGGIIYRTMYANLSCALVLQKLFKTYISSSSGHGKDLETGLIVPTQNYENLICDSCKTETIDYISSDNVKRLQKLEKLANDKLVQKYMNVCFSFGNINCGKCYGCLKTMISLDLMNKLNDFNNVFNLKDYYEHRLERIKILVDGSTYDGLPSIKESWNDLVNYAKSHNGELSNIILEQNLKTAIV